jgi:hypothetical protein
VEELVAVMVVAVMLAMVRAVVSVAA